jgi:predicted nucleic acid-binding protein
VLLSLLREDLSAGADELFELWREDSVRMIAPRLLFAEVPSGLRYAIHRRRIAQSDGNVALQDFLAAGIEPREPHDLVNRAWEIGKVLKSPRLYDVFYIALAGMEECELWTADRRLANLAGPRYPFVRWVGDVLP